MIINCRETRSEAFFRVTREINLYLVFTFYCWHCKIMRMQKYYFTCSSDFENSYTIGWWLTDISTLYMLIWFAFLIQLPTIATDNFFLCYVTHK